MRKIFGAILIVGMMLITSGISVGALTKTNNEFVYDDVNSEPFTQKKT